MSTDKVRKFVVTRDAHGRFISSTPVAPAPVPPSAWAQFKAAALNIPTPYATALALVCGALTVLNQTTFGLPPVASTTVTWVLAIFAFIGIGPILGPKFRAAVHLSAALGAVVSIALTVALVVCQEDVTLPYRAIIIGLVQVAGGLGFAPAFLPTV